MRSARGQRRLVTCVLALTAFLLGMLVVFLVAVTLWLGRDDFIERNPDDDTTE
jgi:hypothetical protein